MKVLIRKNITPKIETFITAIGKTNFSVIINNIIGYVEGSDWASNHISLIEKGEFPIYVYRFSNYRLIFTHKKTQEEEKIVIVDVIQKKWN